MSRIWSITYYISYTQEFLRIIFQFSAMIININRNRNFIATNTQIRMRKNKQTMIIHVKFLNCFLKELSRIEKVNETKKNGNLYEYINLIGSGSVAVQ